MKSLHMFLAFALALPALADQAQVLGLEEAEYATMLMEPGREIRHFCAPCGDTRWRPEAVGSVEAVPWPEDENMVELHINGAAVDLAYVYFQQGGKWRNLARFLGLPVNGVPADLAEEIPPAVPDAVEDEVGRVPEAAPAAFSRTHLRGTIGEKLALLAELAGDATRIGGAYRYAHVQQPIALHGGAPEGGGALLLKEYAEGRQTGEWSVNLTRAPLALSGEWRSADKSKKLPLELKAYAVSATTSQRFEANQITLTLSLEYPIFLEAGHPRAKQLNQHLRTFFDGLARDARNSMEEAAAEGFAEGFPEDARHMLTWSYDAGNYHFLHCSDSFVSLVLTHYEYSGGAHGNSGAHTLNLALSPEGNVSNANLSAFLAEGDESIAHLSTLLIADLKKQGASTVVDGGITAFTREELPAFTASRKGLTFYFDPYAVGPYAEGSFTVEIPWVALKEHAKQSLVE